MHLLAPAPFCFLIHLLVCSAEILDLAVDSQRITFKTFSPATSSCAVQPSPTGVSTLRSPTAARRLPGPPEIGARRPTANLAPLSGLRSAGAGSGLPPRTLPRQSPRGTPPPSHNRDGNPTWIPDLLTRFCAPNRCRGPRSARDGCSSRSGPGKVIAPPSHGHSTRDTRRPRGPAAERHGDSPWATA